MSSKPVGSLACFSPCVCKNPQHVLNSRLWRERWNFRSFTFSWSHDWKCYRFDLSSLFPFIHLLSGSIFPRGDGSCGGSSKKHHSFQIGDSDHNYVGCFSLNLLKTSVLQKDLLESIIIAQDLAVPDIEIDYFANLEQAMEIFGREDVAEISVLKNKKIIGVIKRKDVIEAYNHEISMKEAASGLVQKLKFSPVTKTTDIGKGFQITEIDAPASFWGKSLKELKLKAQHRIDILLIKRKSPLQTITLPSADEIIKKEDTLILVGHEDNIKKITLNKAG